MIDDYTYYNRIKNNKHLYIEKFVIDNYDNINKVYDVGCNNGKMSYFLQEKYNKEVLGVDLLTNLNIPTNYMFKNINIVMDNTVYFNDMTLFLSVYHHILNKYSLDIADKVFFKLLLRTKYLIFDVGNLSEKHRSETAWYIKQQKYFKNEDELLDHFNIKYDILGEWKCGSGVRKIVVFKSKSFDNRVENLNTYKHMPHKINQRKGLFDINKSNGLFLYDGTTFNTLKLNNFIYFAKKHRINKRNKIELNNIIKVYNCINKHNLIDFYGYSKRYGLIYEYIDSFKYKGKTILNACELTLTDVDVIKVNNNIKYIDFYR